MSPEERELLEKSVALSLENNKMLHAIRRSMFWSRMTSYLYWILIIGVSIGAFYFLQPYLDKVVGLYNSISGTQQKINDSQSSLQDFLKKF
jgi:hypothetical protein